MTTKRTPSPFAINPLLDQLIDIAFAEDVSAGDVTTNATVPRGTQAAGRVLAKEDFVIAGCDVFQRVYDRFGGQVDVTFHKTDGERAVKGEDIITLQGDAHALLIGERPALNFLMRLSGIATKAARVADVIKDYPHCRVVDTRKTTPGWRGLEKAAVRAGGAFNHRYALYDGIMIKENHIACAGGITPAVQRARHENHHLLKIEVETTTLDEVREACAAGADVIMLDNMDNALTADAIKIIREHDGDSPRQTVIEASGNMTEARLSAVAALGVNVISMGALTHSAMAVDVSMKLKLG